MRSVCQLTDVLGALSLDFGQLKGIRRHAMEPLKVGVTVEVVVMLVTALTKALFVCFCRLME